MTFNRKKFEISYRANRKAADGTDYFLPASAGGGMMHIEGGDCYRTFGGRKEAFRLLERAAIRRKAGHLALARSAIEKASRLRLAVLS